MNLMRCYWFWLDPTFNVEKFTRCSHLLFFKHQLMFLAVKP
jgi:hypothetical protein